MDTHALRWRTRRGLKLDTSVGTCSPRANISICTVINASYSTVSLISDLRIKTAPHFPKITRSPLCSVLSTTVYQYPVGVAPALCLFDWSVEEIPRPQFGDQLSLYLHRPTPVILGVQSGHFSASPPCPRNPS